MKRGFESLPRAQKKGLESILLAKQKNASHSGKYQGHREYRNDINHAFLMYVYAKNAHVCAKTRLKKAKTLRRTEKLSKQVS